MNIKKIIREEMGEFDDFQWVKDINPTIPITQLGPEEKYRIVKIEGQALRDYIDWGNRYQNDPYKDVFIMDKKGCFTNLNDNLGHTDYANEDTTDVWVEFYNRKHVGTWISVNTIMVQRIY